MSKRVTIMLEDEIDRKLRVIQAKKITKASGSVSFSRVLNDALKGLLK